MMTRVGILHFHVVIDSLYHLNIHRVELKNTVHPKAAKRFISCTISPLYTSLNSGMLIATLQVLYHN